MYLSHHVVGWWSSCRSIGTNTFDVYNSVLRNARTHTRDSSLRHDEGDPRTDSFYVRTTNDRFRYSRVIRFFYGLFDVCTIRIRDVYTWDQPSRTCARTSRCLRPISIILLIKRASRNLVSSTEITFVRVVRKLEQTVRVVVKRTKSIRRIPRWEAIVFSNLRAAVIFESSLRRRVCNCRREGYRRP